MACYLGVAALQVDGDILDTVAGTKCFFGIGAAMGAVHALDGEGQGLHVGAAVCGMAVVVVVFARACIAVHEFHAQDVKQQYCEQYGACPLEGAAVCAAFCCAYNGWCEPFAWHEVVDAVSEGNGSADDADEIEAEGFPAQYFVYDEYAGGVAGWSCHKEYEGGSGGEAFEHKGYSNGNTACCAQVHGYADTQDEEHGHEGVVLECGEH